ncbi:MAG: ABC transporter ATP-binding protein [Ruminococcus sp.]|nr:ABC transporter ATP-binding protein [Ruminococcus sp.]
MEEKEPILEICGLSVSFGMYDSVFRQRELEVISDLALTVRCGEMTAVAGASGSGKSLLAAAVLGILPANAKAEGIIRYKGRELTPRLQKQLRGREIAFVPQSVTYLDPLMKAGRQAEGHIKPPPVKKRREVWERLGLPESAARMYPFQLSGGMARRVLASSALMGGAQLLIADEPTPGMTAEQSEEALKMLREMADEGRGVVLITHDIALAVEYADKVAVFYAGTTVETAPASDFKKGSEYLRHPYSKALWNALPQNGFTPAEGFQPYAGEIPFHEGCLFAPRCPVKRRECEKNAPPAVKVRGGEVRCFYAT